MDIFKHVKRGTFYSVLGAYPLSCQGFVMEGDQLKILAHENSGQARIVPDAYEATPEEYFLMRGELQSETPLGSGEMMMVYQSRDPDGKIWIRPIDEFNDGRFVRMD